MSARQATQGAESMGALGEVAIIGGGIAGLASAHFLSRAGASVTLFESSSEYGGLGGTFECCGAELERFYHCMLPSDRDLLGLLEDLDIVDEVYWKETSFGIHAGDRVFPLNRPLDLLRFEALPLWGRLRLGITGLSARHASAAGLDDITCESWLRRLSGSHAFEAFWRPMLEAKFGDRYHEVPALWFWTRLNREKGGGVERKGYIHGGYRRIIDRLVGSLRERGHRLYLDAPIEALSLGEQGRPRVRPLGADWQDFDRLVFAAPLPVLARAAEHGGFDADIHRRVQDIDMIGVLNVVLTSRKRLTPHYWVSVPDPSIPFQGVVESTNLIEPSDVAGMSILHLLRYTHRDEPIFDHPDKDVLDAYLAGFRQLFPDFFLGDDVQSFVFRTPFVEPVYTTGYLDKQPPAELVPGRVYLATSAQVYPEVTSWNGSVGMVRKVVARMLGSAGS